MSTRILTSRAMAAIVLVVTMVAACSPASGGQAPAASVPPATIDEPPQDPLDCETDGYPCALAEVEPSILARSRELGRDAAERLGGGESIAATVAWLEAADGVAEVVAGDDAIRFRLTGGRALWVLAEPPTGATSTSHAGALRTAPTLGRPDPVLSAPRPEASASGLTRDGFQAVVNEPSPQKRAIVLSPFGYWDGFAGASDIAAEMRTIRGYEAGVDLVEGTRADPAAVTVDAYKTLDQFDVVYLHTFGSRVCPLPRSCYGVIAAALLDDPEFHLPSTDTTAMDILTWQGDDGRTSEAIGLEADFFRRTYPQRLQDALIFMDVGGAASEQLARPIMGTTSRYYHWLGAPERPEATHVMMSFVHALGETGRPADAVFQQMQDDLVSGAARIDGKIATSQLGLRDLRIREVVTVRNVGGDALNDREIIGFEGTAEDGNPDVIRLAVDVEGVNPGEEAAQLRVTVGQAETQAYVLADDATQVSDFVWRVEVEIEHPDVSKGQELAISAQAPLADGGTSWQELTVIVDDSPEPEIGRVYRGTATTTIQSADGLAATYTADVTLTRNPDQDPDARMVEFMVTEGTFHWSVVGATLNGCAASAPVIDVPMPVETEYPALTIVRPKEPGQPITYIGNGELSDGPAVEVSLDCPNLGDTTFTDHADGVWFYAPRDEAFELAGDTITGTYQYGEELVREFRWSFTRVE